MSEPSCNSDHRISLGYFFRAEIIVKYLSKQAKIVKLFNERCIFKNYFHLNWCMQWIIHKETREKFVKLVISWTSWFCICCNETQNYI